jgi:predicted tellurium resistance membrane protein TerC
MQIIEKLYGPFFSGADWHAAIMTTNGWIAILTLTIMECLLSVDNAVVLATQTSSLHDKHLEKRALMYGLWAHIFFDLLRLD